MRRSRFEVAMAVLATAQKELPEYKVMKSVGISYRAFRRAADSLFNLGLLSMRIDRGRQKARVVYAPTASGLKALELYRRLRELVP